MRLIFRKSGGSRATGDPEILFKNSQYLKNTMPLNEG